MHYRPVCSVLSLILACVFVFATAAISEESPGKTTFKADTHGEVQPDEFEVMNANGGLTRKSCPWTCEMRGIPEEHCKMWKSPRRDNCYVWDTRLPQDAVVPGKHS